MPPSRRSGVTPGYAVKGDPRWYSLLAAPTRPGCYEPASASAVPNIAASSFTVHLSKAVSASTSVAWFVVN